MKIRSFQGTRADSVEVARELRQEDTRAEQAVWKLLRDRHLTGLKFRRQHPLGQYTVDFFCYELHLAIELDGSVHSQPSQIRKDAVKDKYLERLGVRVLRIPNGMPLQDPEAFFKQIRKYHDPHPPRKSGHPLPEGEGSRNLSKSAFLPKGPKGERGGSSGFRRLSHGPTGRGSQP